LLVATGARHTSLNLAPHFHPINWKLVIVFFITIIVTGNSTMQTYLNVSFFSEKISILCRVFCCWRLATSVESIL